MFLAVGSGAYIAAIFLMVAHAFFKGQLFLGAGSVIHGMDDEQDLKKMGGLRSYMPLTAATFVFGWLAIAGVFPLAGFWAKGDVLSNAFERFPILWAIGLVTALLTAYYMTRLYVLAFTGDSRWRQVFAASRTDHAGGSEPHLQPHESPAVMTFPLIVLAALSLLGGLLDLPWWHSGIVGTALLARTRARSTPAHSVRFCNRPSRAFVCRRPDRASAAWRPDGGCGMPRLISRRSNLRCCGTPGTSTMPTTC